MLVPSTSYQQSQWLHINFFFIFAARLYSQSLIWNFPAIFKDILWFVPSLQILHKLLENKIRVIFSGNPANDLDSSNQILGIITVSSSVKFWWGIQILMNVVTLDCLREPIKQWDMAQYMHPAPIYKFLILRTPTPNFIVWI